MGKDTWLLLSSIPGSQAKMEELYKFVLLHACPHTYIIGSHENISILKNALVTNQYGSVAKGACHQAQ